MKQFIFSPNHSVLWPSQRLKASHGSVPNYCQSACPKQATLEEDQELFLRFSSILCLWFEIQGRRTDNFFDWVLNTGHGYNHKAGLLWLYREWVTLDWHKHKWPAITWNAWCKGEIIEFPKHVSHQNFKHLQLETDIHEKGSRKNSLCSAYTEINLC